MRHTVVETDDYIADAKTVGLSEDERADILDFFALHPDAGKEIRGTGGARKIRFAGRGKGKRGGYRVITFYSGMSVPVFLMSIYSKSRKEDMTQTERNELKRELEGLVANYLKGATYYVRTRTKAH